MSTGYIAFFATKLFFLFFSTKNNKGVFDISFRNNNAIGRLSFNKIFVFL